VRILEIEKYFQQDDTLNKVLEALSEDIDKIDYWAGLMKQGITVNPEEAKNALNDLTGRFMSLKTALSIAETEKKNRETRAYNQIKIDTENEGKKFVSASAEKEASGRVADYRRIRNIIQAYVDSCEKALSTLQSLLKYMGEEIKLQGYNKGEK